jgi:hypothetical protein
MLNIFLLVVIIIASVAFRLRRKRRVPIPTSGGVRPTGPSDPTTPSSPEAF